MFHIFNSQEERREYGGSAFIEIQFCRLPNDTSLSEIVAVNSIKNWMNNSLYVDDENEFYSEYSHIFDCGTYNNMKNGRLMLTQRVISFLSNYLISIYLCRISLVWFIHVWLIHIGIFHVWTARIW